MYRQFETTYTAEGVFEARTQPESGDALRSGGRGKDHDGGSHRFRGTIGRTRRRGVKRESVILYTFFHLRPAVRVLRWRRNCIKVFPGSGGGSLTRGGGGGLVFP